MPDLGVDLSSCDREPIHLPGSIQPHGCLLACDPSAAVVTRYSENAPAMLGLETDILGRDLPDLIGGQPVHDLRNAMTATAGGRSALLMDFEIDSGRRFDVSVHRYDGATIIEFEPAKGGKGPLHRARELIGRISDATSVQMLLSRSARLAQALLGYDRVMIYRFEEDGAGKVVNEVRRPDLESFLGQYFPASDIPAQARELYLRNTLRVISDTDNPRVPIIPRHAAGGAPLDLSFAHLRSVSPIHCEYLRNMGVAASMSISIVVDGRLWGLVACHHYSPRVLPMTERVAAELFGQFLSLHLHALQQRESLVVAASARRALDRFLRLAATERDLERLLTGTLPDFARLVPCDGIGLWFNGRWHPDGTTPPPEAMSALIGRVAAISQGGVWSTQTLGKTHPPVASWADDASGLLSIPLSQTPRDWLLFFRRAFVHTIDWAGDPSKTYSVGPLGDRLTPRTSFAIWKETVADQSQPWTAGDRETAEAIRAAAVEVVLRHNELMAEERGKADARQRVLNEELNHRVKNILAVIQSLVGHPVGDGRSLEEHVAALRGRIQALAFAHDQVVRGDGGGLLAELLRAELGPFGDQGGEIDLAGPDLWLDSRSFSVMALVLHELATNAAKYGALSRPSGRLSVAWRLSDDGSVEIDWTESGGPRTRPPERSGFGTALIERSIPFDLGGTAHVVFGPTGVVARFTLPAEYVSLAEAPAGPRGRIAPEKPTAVLPGNPSVLLVEDQMLIALDAESMLLDAGARGVATATTADDAYRRLGEDRPDVAVLDVNLGRTSSLSVAEELTRLDVPFIFATGYGDGEALPERFRAVPVVRKPYSAEALTAAVASVLTRV